MTRAGGGSASPVGAAPPDPVLRARQTLEVVERHHFYSLSSPEVSIDPAYMGLPCDRLFPYWKITPTQLADFKDQ